MADPAFTVGGLATGMDTQSMIDKLVSLESRPLTLLQNQQSAYRSQVSTLGDITSKLSALQTAARDLASSGVLGLKTTSSNTAFSATPGSSAVASDFSVQVQTLATPAKWQSAAFGASDTVKGGTLTITAGEKEYVIGIADGASPEDIAYGIRTSGAPISAIVLDGDAGKQLSLTSLATGSDAATLSFAETGTTGTKSLGLVSKQTAADAKLLIDGLLFTRSSNTVTDALPGTTLVLKEQGGAAETLSIANDTDATQAKLKTFVDAYNAVMWVVQRQLNVTKETDRSKTLAGDSTVRSLQAALGRIGSTVVGSSSVRSLADLGLETQQTGTLLIDSTTLASAIARDPNAVNRLFADATGGISKITSDLVTAYTGAAGMLSVRQKGLQDQIRRMDDQAENIQRRIDSYRKTLMSQFTAMEKVVSGYKSIGNFLTNQSLLQSK
jgi:flagellar hook-associated protein 2